MVVLVTGSNGQVGQAIRSISNKYTNIDFIFCDSQILDITKKLNCQSIFEKYRPDYCINTAGYTAVDQAEMDRDKAFAVNGIGVENLVGVCLQMNTVLIHISTDFVFDGLASRPYLETDSTFPKTVYGLSKLAGERAVTAGMKNFYILRTSWVYSEFGNNFMNTMLKLARSQKTIKVVDDQIGTPTHAVDLATVIVQLINQDTGKYGIYHYSSAGYCSWYEFALEIFRLNQLEVNVFPISTSEYPSKALRPKYSVLDKIKISETFDIQLQAWQVSIPKF